MKLNLNFNLLGIDEQELPDSNAGKIIAQCLANDTDGDCLKYWEWAIKLSKGESIELDISDKEKLYWCYFFVTFELSFCTFVYWTPIPISFIKLILRIIPTSMTYTSVSHSMTAKLMVCFCEITDHYNRSF